MNKEALVEEFESRRVDVAPADYLRFLEGIKS
jgi:hypothetical protein